MGALPVLIIVTSAVKPPFQVLGVLNTTLQLLGRAVGVNVAVIVVFGGRGVGVKANASLDT
jgi:hypothetical protein